MAFRPSIPALVPSADGKTFGIRGWHVFAPGYWKGELFSPARIKGVVETYKLLKSLIPGFSPKLRLGHDTKKRLTASLGLPNAGRIVDVRPTADHGFEVDIDGIPKTALAPDGKGGFKAFDLEEAIRNGNYDGGSVEMNLRMRHPTEPTKQLHDIFDGIALLGEEHRAVKTSGTPTPSDPSADQTRLAFSDFSEDEPVNPKLQMIADAMKMDVNDPAIQSLTPEQIEAFAESAQGAMGAGGATPPPPVADPAAAAGAGDPGAGAPDDMKAQFAELSKRCFAAEAAISDMKATANGTAASGAVTMSEAYRRIEEASKEGKFPGVLIEAKKLAAKEILGLPANKLCFSDGEHKGRAQIAVFLEELESRPADLMFSEIVNDSKTGDGDEITPSDRRKMGLTRAGRQELAWLDAQAKAAK